MPCHVRKEFNRATGNLIETQTLDSCQYDLNIKKKSGFPTRLYGSEYKSLLAAYDMQCGDKILFDMTGDPCQEDYLIPILVEAANGEPKNKVQGIFYVLPFKIIYISFFFLPVYFYAVYMYDIFF